MAFSSPYNGNVSRKMNKFELLQALKQDLSGEIEAIYFYEGHAYATDDPVAREVLLSISNEEKVHVGELTKLINYLEPSNEQFVMEGIEEATEIINKTKRRT